MRTANVVATIALLAALLVGTKDAPAQEVAPPTATHANDDASVSIELPREWRATSARRDTAVAGWDVTTDSGKSVSIGVYHLPGMVAAPAQPFLERAVQPARYGVAGPATPEASPLPHLWLDVPDGGRTRRFVWAYRLIRRNGFTVRFVTDAADWPLLSAQCLAAARSLTSTCPEWPAPPSGYAERVRDGIAYFVQREVKDADAEAVQKLVQEERLAFEKRWKRTPVSPDSPLRVVLCASGAAADAVEPGTSQYGAKTNAARLVVVVPPRTATEAYAVIASKCWCAFHETLSGATVRSWIYAGEGLAALNERRCGKPLPAIPADFTDNLHTSDLPKLSEVADLNGWSGVQSEAMFQYVAFFRCAGKPWSDAWANFVKDVAATGDLETAQAKHILSLDQDALRAAVVAFSSKSLKPSKAK